MQSVNRQGLSVERLVKKNQDGTLGMATHEPQDASLRGEDMMVLGDCHYTYTAPVSSSSSSLRPWLIAITSILGSMAIASGTYYWATHQSPPTTPPTTPTEVTESVESTNSATTTTIRTGFILGFPQDDD